MKRDRSLLIVVAALALVAIGLAWRGAARLPRPSLESRAKTDTPPALGKGPKAANLPDDAQTETRHEVRPIPTAAREQTRVLNLEEEFRRAQECVSAYRQAMVVQSQLDVCKDADAPQNPMCKSASKDALSAKLAAHARAAANCGEDILTVEVAYFEKTVDLATRGNRDAQLCFAHSMFQLGRPWSDAEISFYKENAPIYLQNAFEQGDWRAVQLFATPRRVLGHSRTLLSFIVPGDPVERYKLNRLLRLGAVDGYAEHLDGLAFDVELPIDPEKRKAAEEWAQKEYEKYFRNSPPLDKAPQPCLVSG